MNQVNQFLQQITPSIIILHYLMYQKKNIFFGGQGHLISVRKLIQGYFWSPNKPEYTIKDLKGKTAIITGGNSGIEGQVG